MAQVIHSLSAVPNMVSKTALTLRSSGSNTYGPNKVWASGRPSPTNTPPVPKETGLPKPRQRAMSILKLGHDRCIHVRPCYAQFSPDVDRKQHKVSNKDEGVEFTQGTGSEINQLAANSEGHRNNGRKEGLKHRGGGSWGHRGALRRLPFGSVVSDLWDPFLPNRDLKQMIRSVDSLFDALASPITGLGDTEFPLWKSTTSKMPWDVRETEDFFELHVDVPGLKKEDLKVYVEDNNLVISGERNVDDNDDGWKRRRYANYKASLVLPDNINTDEIHAELNHGVLELKLIKVKQEAKPQVKEVIVK